jgi:hypothetical protein
MQDFWYADHLDLIKWGILFRLADSLHAKRILQLTFNPRNKKFDGLVIDGREDDIPQEVIAHFRDLSKIGCVSGKVRVSVFDSPFKKKERDSHLEAACAFLSEFSQERCIVFLDPDVGLEPQTGKSRELKHVREKEAQQIWDATKAGDGFAFFQHRTNMAGLPWVETKQKQLASALGVPLQDVKIAHAAKIEKHPVVIYYAKRSHPALHIGNAPSRDEGDAKGT